MAPTRQEISSLACHAGRTLEPGVRSQAAEVAACDLQAGTGESARRPTGPEVPSQESGARAAHQFLEPGSLEPGLSGSLAPGVWSQQSGAGVSTRTLVQHPAGSLE